MYGIKNTFLEQLESRYDYFWTLYGQGVEFEIARHKEPLVILGPSFAEIPLKIDRMPTMNWKADDKLATWKEYKH